MLSSSSYAEVDSSQNLGENNTNISVADRKGEQSMTVLDKVPFFADVFFLVENPDFERVERLIYKNLFENESYVVTSSIEQKLMSVCNHIKNIVADQVDIGGYTGNREKILGFNLVDSKRRATSVYEFLIAQNCLMDVDKVNVYGMASASPIADNVTGLDRIENRRIEILIYKKTD